jgi:hypothetical protein
MKLKIYRTDADNHVTATLDEKFLFSNEYSYENVLRVAAHLGWEVEYIILTESEYEEFECNP